MITGTAMMSIFFQNRNISKLAGHMLRVFLHVYGSIIKAAGISCGNM